MTSGNVTIDELYLPKTPEEKAEDAKHKEAQRRNKAKLHRQNGPRDMSEYTSKENDTEQ